MSEEDKLELENECLLKYSKAQMIQKFIDELEENGVLSDLWCKSQEENQRLHSIIKEVREYIENNSAFLENDEYEVFNKKDILEILDKVDKENNNV